MKKIYLLPLAVVAFQATAQFTSNNLAVLKITSPTAIGNTGIGYAVNVVEYSTAGVATATNINLTGGTPNFVLEERSTVHEGQLSLSSDGRYLSAIGYNSTVGATATTIRGTEKRVVRIDASGVVDFTTVIPTSFAYNGQNIRTAVSASGTSYWINSGSNAAGQGVRTIAHNGPTVTAFNSNTYRSIGRFGGNIYGSFATSPVINFHDDAGVATPLPFATPAVATPEYTQFVFFDMDATVSYNSTGFDLLYIGDRNSGLRKFYFDGTTSLWTPVSASGLYNPSLGGFNGFHSHTGRLEGGLPTLYGIKIQGSYTASHLIKITDNVARTADWNVAGNFPTATLLASTGNTEQFKGVAFTPNSQVPLPVTLTSFTGSLMNNHASLVWKMASEAGAGNYVVERSADGRNYASIGAVTARNSAGANSYTFDDAGVADGTNYYRLKMVDKDGSHTYSKTVLLVKGLKTVTALAVFPNPVTSFLSVAYPAAGAKAALSLYTTDGKMLAQYNLAAGSVQRSLDVSALGHGQYRIVYRNNGATVTSSFVK